MVQGRTQPSQDIKKEKAAQKRLIRQYGRQCQNCGFQSNLSFYKLAGHKHDELDLYRLMLCFKCFQATNLKTPLIRINFHKDQKERVREAWNQAVRDKSQPNVRELGRPQNPGPESSVDAVGCESPGVSPGGSLSPYTA